ncbi:MAG: 1,4-dihydroxy-6-naphthoate synthase [Desulfobulbaceae bacterium]
MTETLSLGFSPCPNDTFIFHALVHGLVPLRGFSLAPPHLEDVETLNTWALEGRLDVTKLSFHALGHVLDRYVMLSAGAALGRGCGPLLVSRAERGVDPAKAVIAIPGAYTTAAMLLRLYEPRVADLRIMRFEEIMPAVAAGRVDAGVIIHESRFTYRDHGLALLRDLGEWWEGMTGLPIPLGCISMRRSFSADLIEAVDEAIRASLRYARAHPEECDDYIRGHAQEMDADVLRSHIRLYVNDFSIDTGEEGRAAVEELLRRGRKAGLFPDTAVEPFIGRSQ